MVRAKKHLGQHFLKDKTIAERTAKALTGHGGYKRALEIGPGTGALTQHLLADDRFETDVIELDRESVEYLNEHYPELHGRIHGADFLKADLNELFAEPFALVGNFPYNISSQILFKVLDYRNQIPEVTGMFQKEVAERVVAGPGSKTYGIISVLIQAWYKAEYLFTVDEHVFIPPPRVKSAVIRLQRNDTQELNCNEKQFKALVKMAFNQRRKTMRNSLKALVKPHPGPLPDDILSLRPEQLSVSQFVDLTNILFAEQP